MLQVLDEQTRGEVLRRAVRRRWRAGDIVFHQGDPGDTLHLVTKGTFDVRVSTTSGSSAILRLVPPGDHFGELALLVPDSSRIARVRAVTDARVLAVPRETFQRLLDTEPSFVRALLQEEAERLVEARTGH